MTRPISQRELYEATRASNWDPELRNSLAEELAHLHEEVSEAFRAWREWHDTELNAVSIVISKDRTVVGKPVGVPAELADVAIGLFYIAERWGFDLWEAIRLKMTYNATRDYQAEGRALHPLDGEVE